MLSEGDLGDDDVVTDTDLEAGRVGVRDGVVFVVGVMVVAAAGGDEAELDTLKYGALPDVDATLKITCIHALSSPELGAASVTGLS